MDHDAVLAQFDRQMRRDAPAGGHGARVEQVGGVLRRVGADSDDWNGVIWSDLDEATADSAIAQQVGYFAALGREFEWKLYAHDRPGDLAARLRAAGLRSEPEETLMVARISDLPVDVEPPEGVRLVAVTDASGVALAADVHEQVFSTSAARLQQRMLSQLADTPEDIRIVVAMAGDVPVCAARLELNPGTDFASLWGGGTLAEWRGRGIYRALIAYRARVAAELGYRYLQVDASSESRPILQRLGFAALSTTTPYVFQP